MICLKHLLIYTLLLPVPSASPVFMVLFAAALFWTVRPCGYCLALLSILFLSTSPSSPFVNTPMSSAIDMERNETVPLGLQTARPGRGWFSYNGGRVFDPSLIGYHFPSTVATSGSADEGTETAKVVMGKKDQKQMENGRTEKAQMATIPNGYVDLRWKGVGFILDLGWRRTKEGLLWEGMDGMARQRGSDEDRQLGDDDQEGKGRSRGGVWGGERWKWTRSLVGSC